MRSTAIALTCIVFTGQLAAAQEFASIPYAEARQMITASVTTDASVASSKVRLAVRTNNPKAVQGDLRLWIDCEDDKTELEIREDGTLVLPTLDDRLAESAWIRSNQPKGTVHFTVIYELDIHDPRAKRIENALVILYEDLFAANRLLRTAKSEFEEAKLGNESRMTAHGIDAVVFSRRDPDQPSRVALQNSETTVDIRPYGRKIYRIPFDQSLVDPPSVVILIPHSGWKFETEIAPQKTTVLKAAPTSVPPKSR